MKLEWDKAGEHYFETGVQNGVLYLKDKETKKYDKAYVWNGLTGVTESPEGAEANDFYADNIKYGSIRSAETFGATIEAYTYPDEFEECDGSAKIAKGVHIGQQPRRPFGFSYRTEVGSDESSELGYKLHLIYNATASPSEKAYETINDSPEAITFSWEIETTPVAVTGYKPTSHIVIDSTQVDSDKLAELEGMLYGTDSKEAHLPDPDEVVALFKEGD